MIICAKFNIIYSHIDKFYDINDTFTEFGYLIYKYELFNDFRNIISKLENTDKHFNFDLNMIVYVSKK